MTRIKKGRTGITWVGEKRGNNHFDTIADMFLRGMKYHPDSINPQEGWVPIAIELWESTEFIIKRITEQILYIKEVEKKFLKDQISWERKMELLESAGVIKKKLEVRLKELGH